MPCVQCGAPVDLSSSSAVVCRFCKAVNQPAPKEVPLELSRLTAVLRGETVKGVTDVPISQDARCASCRGTFPSDRLNITDSGALCDGCWRGEQAGLIRAAEREHTSATGVAAVVMIGLAGAMLGAASRGQSS